MTAVHEPIGIPTAASQLWSGSWRLLGRSVAALTLTGVLLVRSQVRTAHRRYVAGPVAPAAVDLVVPPSSGEESDAAPLELVALGDSGMAGVGVAEAGEALPVQLARRLADGVGRPVHVVGFGRSGARTVDVLAEQLPQVRGPVDVCVLMVGTNDVVRLTAWPRLSRDGARLLDGLARLDIPVVASSLPEFRAMTAVPPALRSLMTAWGGVVRGLQQRAVRRRPEVVLVDVRGAVGRQFVDDPATMSRDGFHPSAHGYALIAEAMAPALVAAVRVRGQLRSAGSTP